MRDTAIIENEKRALQDDLHTQFVAITLLQLPTIAEALESLLIQKIRIVLYRLAPILFNCSQLEPSGYLVAPTGEFYDAAVLPDVQDSSVLLISVLPRPRGRFQRLTQKTISIGGYGKYRKVRFFFTQELTKDLDLLIGVVSGLLESGYAWFSNQVEALTASAEIAMVSDLYTKIRSLLANEHLAKNFWFATITAGYGFRLIDPRVARDSFTLIEKSASDYGRSTNRLVAELLATRLPRHGLLMHTSVTLNRCLDLAELSKARYKQTGSIYASAVAALYGTETLTIYPLYVSDQLSVLGLLPAEDRTSIIPVLQYHDHELKQAIENAAERIVTSIQIFEERSPKRFDIKTFQRLFELKPNLFGIGLNVNEMFERLIGRKPKKVINVKHSDKSYRKLLPPGSV